VRDDLELQKVLSFLEWTVFCISELLIPGVSPAADQSHIAKDTYKANSSTHSYNKWPEMK
jgi:hypothetical protein